MRLWRRRKYVALAKVQEKPQGPICPICERIAKLGGEPQPDPGQLYHIPDVNYDMCWEHFRVIGAHIAIEAGHYGRSRRAPVG